MNLWLINDIAVAALGSFLTGVMIPKILLISFRRKLFDHPDPRKIHHGSVPRLGGLAFTPVICMSIALLTGINLACGQTIITQTMNPLTVSMGFCALMIIYLVGMADDLIGVRYPAKFLAETISACLLIAGGLSLNYLGGILFMHDIPAWFGWPLTVVVLIFAVNAINLIDGLDGLASGLSAIAFAIYGIVLTAQHQYFYALVAFGSLGVLIPFFYYNVFGNAEKQRKIFMGDTGSLTIGILIVFLGFKILRTEPDEAVLHLPGLMMMVLSPMVIPCMDVVRVFMWRIRHHANPFLPDCNHIHHRLLAAGFGQRMAMLFIVCASAGLCVVNVALSYVMNINLVLLLDIAAMCGWNMWLHRKAVHLHDPR
ncbi:MAG: undecaprenyl/decaprenyl-phosphate alpha-N-acetylglucosaminyl 1-phosphate transferase [Muribaculaceae bacterium]|nr:undecaprenyl/decaprenyl-phosphate alpha-N-acetylglucosaminyl 1-phosphate transferase [Muribaculaceae bacterium]